MNVCTYMFKYVRSSDNIKRYEGIDSSDWSCDTKIKKIFSEIFAGKGMQVACDGKYEGRRQCQIVNLHLYIPAYMWEKESTKIRKIKIHLDQP